MTNREQYDQERAFLRDLLIACEKDDVEKVKAMEKDLKSKSSISVCDYRDGNKAGAIHAAARGGARRTLEFLLSIKPEQGALLDARQRTPLMAACSSDESADCVKYLLEYNKFAKDSVNVASDGVACVHLAACLHTSKSLEYILEIGGVNPDTPSNAGTPLHWAAGHAATAATTKLLICSGNVDVNARDHSGCTPLIQACLRGSSDIVRALCDAGADLTVSALNMTALIASAVSGNLECVKIILAKGGENLCLERDAHENLLPIEHAAHAGQKAVVEFLADKSRMSGINADVFIKKIQEDYEESLRKAKEEELAADEAANKAKEEGNKYFLEQKFAEAIEIYETACRTPMISTHLQAVLFSNISASWLKLGNAEKSRENAEKGCAADANFAKAYFRLGQACALLNDHEAAAKAYWDGYNIDKQGKEASTCLQLFKQQIDLGKKAHAAKQL